MGAMEPGIVASWIDGGVCDPYEIGKHAIEKMGFGGLSGMIATDTFKHAQPWTADSLYDTWPLDMAKKIKDYQAMYFVHTVGDNTVPKEHSLWCSKNAKSTGADVYLHLYDDWADFHSGPKFTKQHDKRYTKFGEVVGNFDSHIYSMLYYPEDYMLRMQTFFCKYLDATNAECPATDDALTDDGALS